MASKRTQAGKDRDARIRSLELTEASAHAICSYMATVGATWSG